MHNPDNPHTGRALLLFAALVGGFALYLALRGAWRDAAFPLALAVFAGCYGGLQLDVAPRFHRLLLGLGLGAGLLALALAVASLAGA